MPAPPWPDCIPWEGPRDRKGYGIDGRKRANRTAWEKANGPIPAGMVVRHKCDNPPCVNPDHLLIGTHQDNVRDRDERGRTQKGSTHYRAKLTEETAVFAMARLLSGESQRSVAKSFGVTRSAIDYLWRGLTWKHVLKP